MTKILPYFLCFMFTEPNSGVMFGLKVNNTTDFESIKIIETMMICYCTVGPLADTKTDRQTEANSSISLKHTGAGRRCYK